MLIWYLCCRLGYDIVRGLGHSMLDPLPSLFSFKIKVRLYYIPRSLMTSADSVCACRTLT
jgi:hypothetical protein